MDILKKIKAGEYQVQNVRPAASMFVRLQDFFEASQEYDAEKEKLKKLLASDLHKEYGMTAAQARKAFSFAWEVGHGLGLEEVFYFYLRLVEIVGPDKEI